MVSCARTLMTALPPYGQPACRARTRVLDAGRRSLNVIDPLLPALPLRSTGVGSLLNDAVPWWFWLYPCSSIVEPGAPCAVTDASPVALIVGVSTWTAAAVAGQLAEAAAGVPT